MITGVPLLYAISIMGKYGKNVSAILRKIEKSKKVLKKGKTKETSVLGGLKSLSKNYFVIWNLTV